jgi:carbonic anhydrase
MRLHRALMAAAALPLFLLGRVPMALAEEEDFCYQGDGNCLPPTEWPGICVDGNFNEQSPIDIRDSTVAHLPVLKARYQNNDEITVIMNGHTLEVQAQAGDELLVVNEKRCELTQFHFHSRAEHNVGGVSFPMEAHLVHRCDDQGLLVIGVMMDYLEDEPNRALGAALENAARDLDGNFVEGETTTPDVRYSAEDLLPHSLSRYFNYPGSLTTPPCSETVDWYVMKAPISVSEEQVEEFRRLLSDTSPDGASFNNRPLQDLDDRTVERRGRSSPF